MRKCIVEGVWKDDFRTGREMMGMSRSMSLTGRTGPSPSSKYGGYQLDGIQSVVVMRKSGQFHHQTGQVLIIGAQQTTAILGAQEGEVIQ